jgi:hypothetical protein
MDWQLSFAIDRGGTFTDVYAEAHDLTVRGCPHRPLCAHCEGELIAEWPRCV